MELKSSRCDFGKEVIFRKADHPGAISAKYSMVSSRLLLDELLEAAGNDVDEEAVDPCCGLSSSSSVIGRIGCPLVFSLLLLAAAGAGESSKVTLRFKGGVR